MSFGRNPHVAKAEAEELKATNAKDASASELAWREAARQWDRAAERETDARKRQDYETKAETARANADSPDGVAAPPRVEEDEPAARVPSKLLN